MDSPTTPITNNSCEYFEDYGLNTASYSAQYRMPTRNAWETPQDICMRKCRSIEPILKDNWTELIFTVKFPDLISNEKLMHRFSTCQSFQRFLLEEICCQRREMRVRRISE